MFYWIQLTCALPCPLLSVLVEYFLTFSAHFIWHSHTIVCNSREIAFTAPAPKSIQVSDNHFNIWTHWISITNSIRVLMTLILTHMGSGRHIYAYALTYTTVPAHTHTPVRVRTTYKTVLSGVYLFFFGFIIWNLVLLTFVIDKSPYMHSIICTYTLTYMHQHTQSNFKTKSFFRNRSITAQTPYNLDFHSSQINYYTSVHKAYVCVCICVCVWVCIIGKQFYRQQNVNIVYQDSCSNRFSVCITISDGICKIPFRFFVSISLLFFFVVSFKFTNHMD